MVQSGTVGVSAHDDAVLGFYGAWGEGVNSRANRPSRHPRGEGCFAFTFGSHRRLAPVTIRKQRITEACNRMRQRLPNWIRRNAWRTYGALVLLGALGVVAAGAFALLRTPSWYAPPAIAADQRQRVRNNLVEAEQRFTESLRADQPFVYHLYAEDLNRWIAMRREIYPLLDSLTPADLAEPFVIFESGEITVAGRYKLGGVDVIVSLDFAVDFTEGAINIRALATRCGSARVPLDTSRLGLDRAVNHAEGKLWPGSPRIRGDLVTGLRMDAEGWWKNGGIAYRVTDLMVEPGRISITVQPLGRRPPPR